MLAIDLKQEIYLNKKSCLLKIQPIEIVGRNKLNVTLTDKLFIFQVFLQDQFTEMYGHVKCLGVDHTICFISCRINSVYFLFSVS
jgi:hypothetical protein